MQGDGVSGCDGVTEGGRQKMEIEPFASARLL